MRTGGFWRSPLRWLVFLVLTILAAAALLHTQPVREAAKRLVVSALDERLGGSSSIGSLDYNLWAGELRATQCSFEDEILSARIEEVVVHFRPFHLTSIALTEPHIRIESAAEESDASFEVPPSMFETALSVTGGSVSFRLADARDAGVELDGLDLRLDADASSVNVESGRVQLGDDLYDFGPIQADFRLRARALEIELWRVERGTSVVTGAATIDAFSPLAVAASMEYSIEDDLVREAVPELFATEPIRGSVTVRFSNDAWSGAGTTSGTLGLDGLVEPVTVRAPWRVDGNVFRVEPIELTGYGGNATASATWDLSSGVQAVNVSFDHLDLHPQLASSVSGTGSVSLRDWDTDSARGHARLRLRAHEVSQGIPLDGTVEVNLADGRLDVNASRLLGAGFELDVSGFVSQALSLRYRARIDELDELNLLPEGLPFLGGVQIEGLVEGPMSAPRATAHVRSESLSASGVPLELDADLVWAGSRIRLDELALRNDSGGSLTLAGDYDVASSVLSLQGRGANFTAPGIPELDASVRSLELTLEGPLEQLQGQASAALGEIRFRGVPLPAATLDLETSAGEARMTILDASDRPWASVRADTTSPYRAEAKLELDALPVGALLGTYSDDAGIELDIDGVLSATAELIDLSTLRFRLDGDKLVGAYRDLDFGISSAFALEGDPNAVRLENIRLVGDDTGIVVEGQVPLTPEGFLDLHANGATRLELLNPWIEDLELGGEAELELRATGKLSEPNLVGELSISRASARVAGMDVADVGSRMRLGGDRVLIDELHGTLLDGRFRADGVLPFSDDEMARIRFNLEGLRPSLLAGDGDADSDVEALVSASGEIQAPLPEPTKLRGFGQIDSVVVESGALSVRNDGPSSWAFRDGVFQLDALRLRGSDTDFTIFGELSPLAEPLTWRAEVSGLVNAGLVAEPLEELGLNLTGTAELSVRAGGGVEALSLTGKVTFEDAQLAVREPAMVFTNLRGELELDNDRVRLIALDANVGGGSMRAAGDIAFARGGVTSVELQGQADSVRLSYPDGLRSEMDGSLALIGAPGAMTLSGDITVARGIFSRDVNLRTELLQSVSSAGPVAPEETVLARTRLDVRVRTREGLRVDNNLARLETSADVTIRGTLQVPELSGSVSAREGGEFRFGRNSYRIETAQMALTRYPFEPPELDISARTSVSDYDIKIEVSGSTDDLTTAISGESRVDGAQLSRMDAASVLVTGRPIDRISSESRAIVGEQLASYLGSSLADMAQAGLGAAVPFDIVTAEPALVAQEADPSARFTLGAALNSSLSVVYSIGLNDAEKQIWIVDYKLPRRMRSQLIRQDDNEFTFAFGQQWLYERQPDARERNPRVNLARIGFDFVTGEPGDLEARARARLGLEAGDRYDYGKAWDRVDDLREWLRREGFLEATVDLHPTPCGVGCVELDVAVVTGGPVRFTWEGDELDKSIQRRLMASWDGRMTSSFLSSDLESLAEGMLFERRYYMAHVEVVTDNGPSERVVTVSALRGPRGKQVVVDFTENEVLSDAELSAALPGSKTSQFHELITSKMPRLKQLLRSLYASKGFLRARIGDPASHFDDESGVLLVKIDVREGERSFVGSVQLTGVETFSESVLIEQLSLQRGAPLVPSQLLEDRSAIAAYYRRAGFSEVEVDASLLVGDTPATVDAKFVVDEGPKAVIGEIRVTGNVGTRESVIRRELTLTSGAPLTRAEIGRSQKRLYDLGIFRDTDIIVEPPAPETTARNIIVDVTESPSVVVDYGLRYTTDRSFQVVADVVAPNLFGRAQRTGVRTLLGRDDRIFRFTYRTPYFARFDLDTDFFVERAVKEENPSDEEDFRPFIDRSWTFTAQQARPLAQSLSLQWSYSFKRTVTELEPSDDDTFDPVISVNRSIFTTAFVGDYRNTVVNPSRGSLFNVTFQGAPRILGADLTFLKIFGQAYTFVSLGKGIVWAGGYRAGAANSFGQRLVEDDRFQAGGPSSVRGFSTGSLGPIDPILGVPIGGKGVLVFNQEIRFPIYWRFRGVGFYDAGNAFEEPSDISLAKLRSSVGAGLRVELPFGLLRFDWAWPLDPREGEDPWQFIFSLGHAF